MAEISLANDYQLILASQSPRRKELLQGLGYKFRQYTKSIDESFPKGLATKEVAEYLSEKKGQAYEADLKAKEIIITADTIVCLDNKILGKANDAEEAFKALKLLSGKKHEVITGVCLQKLGDSLSFSVSTTVYFKELSDDEINYYIANFKPFDKAGAYGIQEWIGYVGVERIIGSYYNVMGLPLKELHEALNQFSIT